jgi:hypothetical protein
MDLRVPKGIRVCHKLDRKALSEQLVQQAIKEVKAKSARKESLVRKDL